MKIFKASTLFLVLLGSASLIQAQQPVPTPAPSPAIIEAALKKGGNKNYTVLLLPGLNHLFQTAQTGLPSEYGEIQETISLSVLQTMSDWILKQTSQTNQKSQQ